MKKIAGFAAGVVATIFLWYLAERHDFFKADYKDLTAVERSVFTQQSDPTFAYRDHFGDKNLEFPRQPVDLIKLFRNTPILGTLTTKTLKREFNADVIRFFNDPENFGWGETTWSTDESEYILRFYHQDKIVGKIYLCLKDCGRIETRPFTPNVKFGQLAGDDIEKIINDRNKWE